MNITWDTIDVEVTESTFDNEDDFGGRWGWFWQECHLPPRGPFGSPAEAFTDFADWIAKHDPDSPAAEIPDEIGEMALTFIESADELIRSAREAADSGHDGHLVLSKSCAALESILQGYLLSRGRSDIWNQQPIRHDLQSAWRQAVYHGLPDDDARIERFLKIVSVAYARQEVVELSYARPNLLAEVDYLLAISVLRRSVERRLPGGIRILRRPESSADTDDES
jgi:hypothetical protein